MNSGIQNWERACVIEWARDTLSMTYNEIAALPGMNCSNVSIFNQYRRWKNHQRLVEEVNLVDARQALAGAITNETGQDLNEELMAAIDRILSALWLFGFKLVEI